MIIRTGRFNWAQQKPVRLCTAPETDKTGQLIRVETRFKLEMRRNLLGIEN